MRSPFSDPMLARTYCSDHVRRRKALRRTRSASASSFVSVCHRDFPSFLRRAARFVPHSSWSASTKSTVRSSASSGTLRPTGTRSCANGPCRELQPIRLSSGGRLRQTFHGGVQYLRKDVRNHLYADHRFDVSRARDLLSVTVNF